MLIHADFAISRMACRAIMQCIAHQVENLLAFGAGTESSQLSLLLGGVERLKLHLRAKNGAIPRRPGLDCAIEIVPLLLRDGEGSSKGKD